MKRKNVNITLSLLFTAAVFIIFCPLPYRVVCTLELKPRDATPIYVEVPGRLELINVKAGQLVKTGDLLGRVSNSDLEMEISDLEARVAQDEARLAVMRRAIFVHKDEEAARNLSEVEESLASTREQLAQKKDDQRRLELVATSDGTVLPSPETPSRPEKPGDLPKWGGNPLEKKNLGAFLGGVVLYCQIGDPHKMEANLFIDQDDIEFVFSDQTVAIKLDEYPYRTYHGQIAEIGPEQKVTPRQLSSKSGGELMSKSDASGMERPMNTTYQARVPLDDPEGKLVQGLRGTAKIHAAWQPIGHRVWRYLIRTFNFKL